MGVYALLAVNFQEVVHSVRTGNVDVAKPQRFAGGPNEHPQQCPPHPQRSRGHGSCGCGPALEQGSRPRAASTPPPRRWPNGSIASRLKASLACATVPQSLFHRQAKSRSPQPMRSRDCAGSARPRQAHRRRTRRLPGVRLAHPQTPRPQPALRPSSRQPTQASLRARDTRRDHPPRHQEARPLQCHRPPHHRDRHWRRKRSPRHRLGVCLMSAIDDAFPRRLRAGHLPGSRGRKALSPSWSSRRRLLRQSLGVNASSAS